jgi:hypothetical protein
VIAMKRHEAKVSQAFQPRKVQLTAQLQQKLAEAGVSAEKIATVAKLIETDRLERIQWSSRAMKQAVMQIKDWYEEAIGAIALQQIEANNTIHQWGE